MTIYIRRNAKRETYTIGALEIAGQKVCDTLEDTDRNLTDRQPEHVIAKLKVAGQTAIPTGTYRVDMDTVSPRFGNVAVYKQVCGGLIHAGNTAQDTHGCILVGENKEKGKVVNSRATFEKLYKMMHEAQKKGEEITVTIC